MADMTGFNPDVAKQELNAFKNYGNEIYHKSIDAYEIFNYALYDSWCSPKAVEFQENHFKKIVAIPENIHIVYTQIYRNATDAYNIIARANGWPTIDLSDQNSWTSHYAESLRADRKLREANENGVVGMSVANVKLARGIFLDEMKAVIELMNETPMNIAFYDPDGAQQAAYKNEIQTRVTNMNEVIDAAMAALDSAMETEENTILLAKNEAAGTMAA